MESAVYHVGEGHDHFGAFQAKPGVSEGEAGGGSRREEGGAFVRCLI